MLNWQLNLICYAFVVEKEAIEVPCGEKRIRACLLPQVAGTPFVRPKLKASFKTQMPSSASDADDEEDPLDELSDS